MVLYSLILQIVLLIFSVRLVRENLVPSISTIISCSPHSTSFSIYSFVCEVLRENIPLLFFKQQRRVQPAILMQNTTNRQHHQ